MKLLIRSSDQSVFGMANLVPKRTGLSADIWSDHKGINRNVSHSNSPGVKIASGDYEVSVSIEPVPQIVAKNSKSPKHSDKLAVDEAIQYVGRNYDLFLKHYNDITDEFDDQDLFDALRERGDYR